ncbi:MAG: hypothetical protein FJZ93_08475 [Chloroflexi bacterium]|nr:hypothetical protein [Chloroflexota bacterium]
MGIPDFNITKFNIPVSVTKAFDKGKIAESYERMYGVAEKLAAMDLRLFYSQKVVELQSDVISGVEKLSVVEVTREMQEYKNQRLNYHMNNMIHILEMHVTSRQKQTN